MPTPSKRAEKANSSPWTKLALARAHALAGDRARAQRELDEVRRGSAQHFVSGYDIAMVYSALGRTDDAVAAIEDGRRQHAERMGYLKLDPQADTLRGDARVQALLEKLGL